MFSREVPNIPRTKASNVPNLPRSIHAWLLLCFSYSQFNRSTIALARFSTHPSLHKVSQKVNAFALSGSCVYLAGWEASRYNKNRRRVFGLSGVIRKRDSGRGIQLEMWKTPRQPVILRQYFFDQNRCEL